MSQDQYLRDAIDNLRDALNEAEAEIPVQWDIERRARDLAEYARKVVESIRSDDPYLKDDVEAMERALARVFEVLP